MNKEQLPIEDENILNEPNYLAYKMAVQSGQFSELAPGTHVAFHDGKFVGSDLDENQLIEHLEAEGLEGAFIPQVNIPQPQARIRHAYFDDQGNLKRVPPTRK